MGAHGSTGGTAGTRSDSRSPNNNMIMVSVSPWSVEFGMGEGGQAIPPDPKFLNTEPTEGIRLCKSEVRNAANDRISKFPNARDGKHYLATPGTSDPTGRRPLVPLLLGGTLG